MDQHQQQLVTCSISEHYNNNNITTVLEIDSLSIIEDDDELDLLLDIDGDCVGVSQKYQKMIHQQKNTEATTESSHPRRSRQLRRRRRCRGRKPSE
jgi:hypothetical protein